MNFKTPIQKLGVFTDPDIVYHNQRDFIGSTELRQMSKSPLHFLEAWKNKEYSEPTPAMLRGSVLHSVLLEQDVSKYVKRPVDDDGKQIAANTKLYKEWLTTIGDKIPVAAELYDDLYVALTRFAENKRAMHLLSGAQVEQSFYAQDSESGLYVKARPDAWGDGIIVDLKTTESVDRFFNNKVFDYGYDFQLAHYAETILSSGHNKIKDFFIIAFESKPPFGMKMYRLSMSDIEDAIKLRKQYLNEISACIKDNKFPGYSDEIVTIEKPKYIKAASDISFEEVG